VVAGVRISSPDRVIFRDPPLTKMDLAHYYEAIGRWIVPHVEGRPLTLVRCPEGIEAGCFFMKHSKVWAPDALRRVRIQEKTKIGEYLIADDLAGVIGLVQMGIVEIHTWNSSFDRLEQPNRIVFDLDPGERVEWPRVVRAARVVRNALAALDLESFAKTTGGRGLHVVVPLAPHAGWEDCLAFARALSERIAGAHAAEYTTDFAKAGRANRILIDYLRNNRTNTSIAAFSTRARAGAPVSVPITWDELKPSLQPQALTAATLPARLARLRADPWQGYWRSRQRLTAQRLRAVVET
jgi:bifunctional non-homologous end joining protein LigD